LRRLIFWKFLCKTLTFHRVNLQSEILHYTQVTESHHAELESSDLVKRKYFWTLYFDGSKSNEGVGVGCVLKDPIGNKTLLACRLEF
jgi:hypothetical protein